MLEHLASFARIFSHRTAYSIFFAKWNTLPLMDNGTNRRKEIILGALYVSNTVLIFTMGRIAATVLAASNYVHDSEILLH